MIDLILLENGLGKPVQPKVHKKQAEGGNHGHQPEVRRCQEPRQNDRGNDLNRQPRRLGNHCGPGAPNGKESDTSPVRIAAKRAGCVKGLQVDDPPYEFASWLPTGQCRNVPSSVSATEAVFTS